MHIFCLMGPTASGKTALAVELVKKFPFEIISVDSAMVYREMNIGTAKPNKETLRIAPHRLVDIRDPKEVYSAAQFTEDAAYEIRDIFSQGKVPLLVGGTMLYFHALQKGLADLPSADTQLRADLSAQGETLGWLELHKQLASIDKAAALRIHPHDRQRIQRALEVYILTGKPLSAWQLEQEVKSKEYALHSLIVAPHSRQVLHDRIAERFKQMLAVGLADEVKKLYERGDLTLALPSMRSVGYHEIWQYLQGQLSYEEMQEKAIIASRQLAKRQLTWLRRWQNATWFESTAPDLYTQVVGYLKNFDLSEAT